MTQLGLIFRFICLGWCRRWYHTFLTYWHLVLLTVVSQRLRM